MNSLTEIKQKVAIDNHFPTWDEYNSIFMQESYEKLAKECWEQALLEVDNVLIDYESVGAARRYIEDGVKNLEN